MTRLSHPPSAEGAARTNVRASRSMPPVGLEHDGPGLCVVVGNHQVDGWKVSILRDGSAPIVLTAEEARTMARDLGEMADICDGKWGE